jgi:arylformamidase
MDQKALDDAYDQSVYAPNDAQIRKRRIANSQLVRQRLGEPKRFAYGSTPIEGLDVFTAAKPNAPVQVFVHGGAWRVGLAKEHCYAAELYVNAGAHFVVLDFINVDQAGGDLMPMAEQVRRAIAWVGKNAASFGGDPNRIYLSGHSSGAHLAGTALVTDWATFGAPPDIIKGAVLCSGLYDLKPARLSKRGAYVKFTDAMEEALSTQRHLARINCPVVLAYGTYETPEFQRQSRDFAAALKAAGKPVSLLVGEAYNHYEMPETFASPYGLLGRAVLEQMKL